MNFCSKINQNSVYYISYQVVFVINFRSGRIHNTLLASDLCLDLEAPYWLWGLRPWSWL